MIKVNRTLELHLKTPTMRRVCLLAVLLLTLAPTVQAASITVRNQGGYVASFAVKGCDQVNNVGDIPLFQWRTVNLDAFDCDAVALEIYIYGSWWYFLPYDNRYPTVFRRTSAGNWVVEGGLPSETGRSFTGDLPLLLGGTTGWATVDWYWVSRGKNGESLTGVDLRGANLSGMDLSGLDLSERWLIDANLSGANLRGASLSGANLSSANLRKASLIKTDLTKANVSKADLTGADLIQADLRKANLSEANLHWVNLRFADLRGADLGGVNLDGADWLFWNTDNTTKCPSGQMGPCW